MRNVLIIALAVLSLSASAVFSQDVGWRTDGTGKYPNATGPTQWAKDKNVVWAATMPAAGNAGITPVGDKLFTTAEPATLLCVSIKDGAILWQKPNTYADILGADEAAKYEKATKVHKEVATLENQLGAIPAQLKKAKAAVTQPAATSQPAQVEKLQAEIAALEAKSADLTPRLQAKKDELAAAGGDACVMPDTNGTNGYASATPASDGKAVVVVFGTGIVACYDLDGNRKWGRVVERGPGGWGLSASPLFYGDKVLVRVSRLWCLDAATGKEIWQAKVTRNYGTPVRTKLGAADVLVTPGGEIVRLADGAIICKGLGEMDFNCPIVEGGAAYFLPGGASHAWKLPAEAADTITCQVLWPGEAKINSDRHYASPVLHDGLLYSITQKGLLTVQEALDGSLVYEQDLKMGTCYPSLTLAGNYLYAGADNGTTVVFAPGRQYKEVATNKLEPYRSCPLFIGTRMYLRTFKNLYCIGQ